MAANDEDSWVFKVNPKLIELFDRFVRVLEMEKARAIPREIENSRTEKNSTGGLVTVADAAKRLCVSVASLRRWVSQRRMPYVKIGRRVLFNPADLDDFIKSCTVQPWKPKGKN
ncbi:MAG: helix-turn-helix domain-containing protein [Desulfobaccales bacterium]